MPGVKELGDGEGLVVCPHVRDGAAILRAVRDVPVDPKDSGWQVLCGKFAHERFSEMKLWPLSKVLEQDPSLLEILEAKPGSTFVRPDRDAPWVEVAYTNH